MTAQTAKLPETLFGALAELQAHLPKIGKGNTAKVPGKDGKQGYCVSPQTRILTHDLRWVEAHKLAVGDRLVAFDEMPQSMIRCRRWRSAEVQAVRWVTQPAYRIYLADGTELVASATHRWLVMNAAQHMTWADTKDLRTPDRKRSARAHPSHLVRAVDIWPEDLSYESGYLAAAFDGEGCLVQTPIKRADGLAPREQTYQLHCTFSQRDNEMRRQVDTLLAHFGFAVQNTGPTGTNGDVYQLRIATGRPEVLRFLGQIRPVRLLSRFSADRLGTFGCKERVAVNAIEFLGEQPVIAVQTSTQTFIAEGFASHNSYSYADLADVSQEILPRLGVLGLSFTSKPTLVDGQFVLVYKLAHISGETDEGIYPLPAGGTPQAIGSAITYARRYCLCAVTGAAPDSDDDDAAAAEAGHRQSAGDVFESAAPGRPRQGGSGAAGGQAMQPDRKAERMDAVPADDPWYTQPAEFAETDQAWIDAALERAVSFTAPAAMRALIAEGREKLKNGEITEDDAGRIAERTKARADELKAAKAKPAGPQTAELDPEDPWAAKVEEITSLEEAEQARAELLTAFKAGRVDETRANRVQAAIAARLAALEGKVIEGTVAA